MESERTMESRIIISIYFLILASGALLILPSAAFTQDVTITVNTSADTNTSLVYDGVLVYAAYGVYTYPVRENVGLIVLYGHGAFLAKTTDDFVTNSDKWRCTTSPDGAWYTLWYDDSEWPPAVEAALPGAEDMQPAQWISAGGADPDGSNYCRGYYGDISTVNLTAEDSEGVIDIYYDGTWQVGRDHPLQIPLPSHLDVIAVDTSAAFFILTTTDGFMTGEDTWRCSATFTKGWQTAEFNDESWPSAIVVSTTQSPAIADPMGHWITAEGSQPSNVLYCRGHYGDFRRTSRNTTFPQTPTIQENTDHWVNTASTGSLYTTSEEPSGFNTGNPEPVTEEPSGINTGLLVGLIVTALLLGIIAVVIITCIIIKRQKKSSGHRGKCLDDGEPGQGFAAVTFNNNCTGDVTGDTAVTLTMPGGGTRGDDRYVATPDMSNSITVPQDEPNGPYEVIPADSLSTGTSASQVSDQEYVSMSGSHLRRAHVYDNQGELNRGSLPENQSGMALDPILRQNNDMLESPGTTSDANGKTPPANQNPYQHLSGKYSLVRSNCKDVPSNSDRESCHSYSSLTQEYSVPVKAVGKESNTQPHATASEQPVFPASQHDNAMENILYQPNT